MHGQNKRNREGEKKPHSDVEQERKLHMETKKALQALQIEYKCCKSELMIVQEERERLKIKVNDFKAIIDINSENSKDIVITKEAVKSINKEEELNCPQCDFPFSNLNEKNNHIKNHENVQKKSDTTQICNVCKQVYDINSDFRKHILLKHQSEYNCQECDFQAGNSQIILSKHMNLRHRNESQQSNDTFKCDKCQSQFSSKWTFYNHKRDKHGSDQDCKFYKQGRCSFPASECWNRRTQNDVVPKQDQEPASIECFICKKMFKTKHQMMLHRKEDHPDRVRQCKNQPQCCFTNCWYMHSFVENENVDQNEQNKTVNSEHNIGSNFQKVPTPPNPPLN